jgi:hypothetical protein
MSYNNFRPRGGYSKGPRSFKQEYSGGNNVGNNNNNGGPQRKRSGASMKDSYVHRSGPNKGQDSGTPVIYGWKVAEPGRRGLLKFVAAMHHKPECKGAKGANWLKFCVTITPPNGARFLTTGFWNIKTERLHMPDMGLIANPAKNYFGTMFKRKN